jgi:hypothetical protein
LPYWRGDLHARSLPAASEQGDHSYVAYLHVDDVDGFHARAVAAGAEVLSQQTNANNTAPMRATGDTLIARRPARANSYDHPPDPTTRLR